MNILRQQIVELTNTEQWG